MSLDYSIINTGSKIAHTVFGLFGILDPYLAITLDTVTYIYEENPVGAATAIIFELAAAQAVKWGGALFKTVLSKPTVAKVISYIDDISKPARTFVKNKVDDAYHFIKNKFAKNVIKEGAEKALVEGVAETYYFRGTTEGYLGNPSLQQIGVTPTSTDPLVSTIFATEAETYGKGVLQIASSTDLKGVNLLEGNVLSALEKEIGIDLAPSQFAKKASINISTSEARGILKSMGYDLPANISSKEQLNNVLKNTPRLSTQEIKIFIQKAIELTGGR